MATRQTVFGVVLTSMLTALGCQPDATDEVQSEAAATDVVWAVNVGGRAYAGIDGTQFDAETSITGGAIGHMETVKGTQDVILYKTFREGGIKVAHPIKNGSYDVTFHFAEPEDIGGGIDDSIFPQQMLVDYARVYRRKE